MLVTLLAWIFITLICWAWGTLMLQSLRIILKDRLFSLPHFSIVCMTGLATITVFAAILSLFMPLGNWLVHIIILSPCLLLLFQKNNRDFFSQLKGQFISLHPVALLLLLASLALVLIMCTWKVNHPDTLGYHAQTIQWIEKYKAVPGLVHLHTRYGYQGFWFIACAFFNLGFTGIDTLTIINATVILWFLLFATIQISKGIYSAQERPNSLLWLALLATSFLSYTQIRLTVTSASPDFITTIFTWLAFYLLLSKKQNQSSLHWLFLIFISVFTIALKLSAVPVLLIAVYSAIQLIKQKSSKAFILSCLVAIAVLLPFASRNIITSGYIAFPSPFPDIANVDWKFSKDDTKLEKNYIAAYARMPVVHEKEKVDEINAMPLIQWLPKWWKNQSHADKSVLILLALSFIACIIYLNRVVRSHVYTKIALLTSIAGVLFWFTNAPDPRFGFGFIISFIAIVSSLSLSGVKMISNASKKLVIVPALACGFVIISYTVYRGRHFFSAQQWVKPIGIENSPSTSFKCNGILFHKPGNNEYCGDLPAPCLYNDSCSHIKFRGDKITDGFKGKN